MNKLMIAIGVVFVVLCAFLVWAHIYGAVLEARKLESYKTPGIGKPEILALEVVPWDRFLFWGRLISISAAMLFTAATLVTWLVDKER